MKFDDLKQIAEDQNKVFFSQLESNATKLTTATVTTIVSPKKKTLDINQSFMFAEYFGKDQE